MAQAKSPVTHGSPIVAFHAAQSADAAWQRGVTRAVGLSQGDRACLALARAKNAVVLTADKPWLQVAKVVGWRCGVFGENGCS